MRHALFMFLADDASAAAASSSPSASSQSSSVHVLVLQKLFRSFVRSISLPFSSPPSQL